MTKTFEKQEMTKEKAISLLYPQEVKNALTLLANHSNPETRNPEQDEAMAFLKTLSTEELKKIPIGYTVTLDNKLFQDVFDFDADIISFTAGNSLIEYEAVIDCLSNLMKRFDEPDLILTEAYMGLLQNIFETQD